MNFYEVVFIVDPEWEGGDLDRMEGMVRDQVVKAGGEIKDIKNQGRQRLAYSIRKRNHGCYFLVRFRAQSERISELSAALKLNPAVIRHLVVKLKEPPADAAPAVPENGEAEPEPKPLSGPGPGEDKNGES